MMRIYIIIILIIFFGFESGLSQKPDFSVLAVKGQVFVKKKDKNNWSDVKVGTKLFLKDEIKLNKGAYIGMVHQNGQTEEINKPGTYAIETIAKKVSSRKSNMTKRFADFVVNEIGSAEDLLKDTDYHKYMGTTGSVERAVGDEVDESEKVYELSKTSGSDKSMIAGLVQLFSNEYDKTIVIKSPRTSFIIDDTITFIWYKNPNVKKYYFKLYDRNDNSVYSIATEDTTIKLNLSEFNLEKNTCYFWTVTSGDFVSNEYCIYNYDLKDRQKIISELSEIKQGFSNLLTPLDYLILASFYEENNIMNRAIESYEAAMKLAPDVKDYKLIYAKYLSRIGLIGEAETIVKAQQ